MRKIVMINKNPAKLQEVVQVGQRQMIKSRSPGTTNLDKREKQEEEKGEEEQEKEKGEEKKEGEKGEEER